VGAPSDLGRINEMNKKAAAKRNSIPDEAIETEKGGENYKEEGDVPHSC